MVDSGRIGIVHYKSLAKEKWEIRYRNPSTGQEIRRVIWGTVQVIQSTCGYINTRALQQGGYLPEDIKRIGLREGFDEGLKHTKADERQRKARESGRDKFLEWLPKHAKKVKFWNDLRANHLWDYERHLHEDEGLKPDTIRLRVEPIKFAWRKLHTIYPESIRDVPESLYQVKRSPDERPKGIPTDVAATFLKWLKEHAPHLYPIALLQAMTGCRMMEGALLRRRDINLEKGLVSFAPYENVMPRQTTSSHPVKAKVLKRTIKNKASERTIPIAPSLIKELRPYVESPNEKYEQVFLNTKGWPWTMGAISHCFTRNRRHSAATPKQIKREGTGWMLTINPHGLGMEDLADVMVRRLRATFNDAARRVGCPESLIDRYMGHAPETVQDRHYTDHMMDEFRALALAVDRAWKEPGILDYGIFSDCCKALKIKQIELR